ncbi:hypothetical protein GONAM_53_00250 [Gordonia namibiensis NBRC 108229]|uniref:Uncharacterized protein n=1 Tax=Gordonia namibiensis NBRC 108229 TaxID=1208314 RepID=K6WSG9_9ACTN|nr:hypothetical protein GONAM_53_00250 [Gordonia namibiensis NBRC 108229]
MKPRRLCIKWPAANSGGLGLTLDRWGARRQEHLRVEEVRLQMRRPSRPVSAVAAKVKLSVGPDAERYVRDAS